MNFTEIFLSKKKKYLSPITYQPSTILITITMVTILDFCKFFVDVTSSEGKFSHDHTLAVNQTSLNAFTTSFRTL